MLQLFFICGGNYKNIFTGPPAAESLCLDTKKRQAYFNSASFVQQTPPPSTDWRRQSLNQTDAKVVSPPRGDFCGGGGRQYLNWTDARVR